MKIKKRRVLYADDVMDLCRNKNLYTLGNCDEYIKMIDMCNKDNITDNQLLRLLMIYFYIVTTKGMLTILCLN